MTDTNPLRTLAGLLSDPRLRIIVTPARLAPSSIYDLQYRLTVIAGAFVQHAKADLIGGRRIQSARLKLLQFVACRPWLFSVLKDWSENRQDAQLSLLSSQRLRRGFLGDMMHDDVVAFLVARSVLVPSETYLISGPHVDMLDRLNTAATNLNVFGRERRVLEDVSAIRVTNSMLEGW